MKTSPILAALFLLTSTAIGNSRDTNEGGDILLRSVRIVDVVSGHVTPPQNIMIKDSEISYIGTMWDAPFDGEIIDCKGKFAVPGLFDCHTHLTYLTTTSGDSLQTVLEEFVARGITFVRDVGGPIDILANLSERISSGEIIGPKIFYSGPMLEKSPLMWANVNESYPGFTVPINTIEDVDSILPSLAEQGARLVKTFNKCDTAVYRHLCEIAKEHDLRLVHDPGTPLFHWIPMDMAIDMGATSIEHAKAPWPVVLKDDLRVVHDSLNGPDSDPMACRMFAGKVTSMGIESVDMNRLHDLSAKMKDNNICLCPTLSVLESMEEMSLESVKKNMQVDEVPEPMLSMIKKSIAGMTAVSRMFVTELAKDSVRMLVGQDGIDPSTTFSEMLQMKDCGVSELEIIRGATTYPSELLGVQDRIGSIAPGKQANILIVDANPLDDIGNLELTFLVISDGKLIAR